MTTTETSRREGRPLSGVRVTSVLIAAKPLLNSRTIKVANSLAAAGADVTVVVSAPADEPLPVGNFTVVRAAPLRASENQVRLLRVAYNICVTRPQEWLVKRGQSLQLLAALLRIPTDVYHANFLDSLWPAAVAAWLRRSRLVYDVRDLYLDEFANVWTPAQMRRFRRTERWASRRADAVIAISRPMAVAFAEWYDVPAPDVIMNGPLECMNVHRERAANEPVRIVFQGMFSEDRNLSALIRAVAAAGGSTVLTLQGWGEIEARLRAEAAEAGIAHLVRFVPPAPPAGVVAAASAHDVGVVLHRGDRINLRVALPNKVHDYLGAGLAVIASDLPGLRSILDASGAGLLVDPDSVESIADAIRLLATDPARLAEAKAAARSLCDDLVWSRQSEHLIGLYRRVLGLVGAGS